MRWRPISTAQLNIEHAAIFVYFSLHNSSKLYFFTAQFHGRSRYVSKINPDSSNAQQYHFHFFPLGLSPNFLAALCQSDAPASARLSFCFPNSRDKPRGKIRALESKAIYRRAHITDFSIFRCGDANFRENPRVLKSLMFHTYARLCCYPKNITRIYVTLSQEDRDPNTIALSRILTKRREGNQSKYVKKPNSRSSGSLLSFFVFPSMCRQFFRRPRARAPRNSFQRLIRAPRAYMRKRLLPLLYILFNKRPFTLSRNMYTHTERERLHHLAPIFSLRAAFRLFRKLFGIFVYLADLAPIAETGTAGSYFNFSRMARCDVSPSALDIRLVLLVGPRVYIHVQY